jgi:hypothetical protein
MNAEAEFLRMSEIFHVGRWGGVHYAWASVSLHTCIHAWLAILASQKQSGIGGSCAQMENILVVPIMPSNVVRKVQGINASARSLGNRAGDASAALR